MARISTYPIDTIVTARDKWIGTDSAGVITKNFSAEDVATYLNSSGVTEHTGSRFTFKRTANKSTGSFVMLTDAGASVSFSSVSAIVISEKDKGERDVSPMYQPLVGSRVLIQKASNPSTFGVFDWNSSNQVALEPEFYDITLTYVGGNGALEDEEDYLISLLVYNVGVSNDKNFVFVQATPSTTWSVNHNLGKFPSVSVVDSAGTQVQGRVDYADSNNLTITFVNQFSGKAYIN